jgi:hypothetical protein
MNISDFQKNFPDKSPPASLTKLLEFQSRSDRFYSGHFELTAGGPATALASFDNDAKAASQFILFGEEVDGSSFGFWLHDGCKLENAPIVFLGSEGGGNVLANSVEEFLALLAVGADVAGSSDESDDPAPRLGEFRKWLKKEFKIEPPANPGEIVFDAEGKHPSLAKWIAAWQKSHFG